MSTEPVQRSHSPEAIYRCAQEGHGKTATWPATSGLPATTHCFRCRHQWATEDPAQNLVQDEQADDGELTPLEIEQAWGYFETFDRMPDWAEGKLSIAPTVQDTGELIPGYESEAWDEPAERAWKTPITFRGMVFTVYTGSVSGSTAAAVRTYLQHEYRAAQIGTPEVAR